jgi:four helix bundle protein
VKNFRELKVWEKSHALALATYKASAKFPKSELFGLTNQIRRACVSTGSNIAEGCGRGSDPELARFLQIAMGSASEMEYQFQLAHDLGYLSPTDYRQLDQSIVEVKRMLASLIQRVKS